MTFAVKSETSLLGQEPARPDSTDQPQNAASAAAESDHGNEEGRERRDSVQPLPRHPKVLDHRTRTVSLIDLPTPFLHACESRADCDNCCRRGGGFKAEKRHHLRNMAFVNVGFFFLFTAYMSLQSLQSSLNSKGGVGLLGLALMNTGAMLSSTFFCSPAIKRFGERPILIVSTLAFGNLIAANAVQVPSYTVASFAVLGIVSGIFWPSQYRYVTRTATAYAKCTGQAAAKTLTSFHGTFFVFFVMTHFAGNLMASLILSPKAQSELSTGNMSMSNSSLTSSHAPYSTMGSSGTGPATLSPTATMMPGDNGTQAAATPPWYFGDCPVSETNFKLLVDDKSRNLLMEVFGGLVVLSMLCMIALKPVRYGEVAGDSDSVESLISNDQAKRPRSRSSYAEDDEEPVDREQPKQSLWRRIKGSSLFCIVRINTDPRMYRLLPLIFVSTTLKSFVYGDYNHFFIAQCVGTPKVGYGMACFGAANAISSIMVTKVSVRWGRPAVYGFSMFLAFVTTIFANFWHKSPDYRVLFGMSAVWGVIDAVWNPTINPLLAALFPKSSEKAYANYALLVGIGFTTSFLMSSLLGPSYLPVFIKSGFIVVGIPIAFYFYYITEKEYGCVGPLRDVEVDKNGHDQSDNVSCACSNLSMDLSISQMDISSVLEDATEVELRARA